MVFLTLLAAAALLLALGLLAWGVLECRLAYRIYANEPIPVMETTREGTVEVEGTVEPAGEVLESPFTERACVAYEYTVEEKRTRSSSTGNSSSTRTTWEEIDSGTTTVPFRVEDDTGSALVEADGVDLRLSSDETIRVRGGKSPPDPIARFIRETDDISDENRSVGIGPLEFATGRDRRYSERVLEVGGPVHVYGTARFDTTAGREAGTVNAVIGADRRPRGEGIGGRLGSSLLATPFLVSDTTERWTALRVALPAVGAIVAGAVVLALGVMVVVS